MTVKYLGSKTRIAKSIVPIIQTYIDKSGFDTYVEPFVGGANVIDKIRCKYKIGFDINPYLIALLNYASTGGVLPRMTYEEYQAIRVNPDAYLKWQVGCAGFLASFNGRFFAGYTGIGIDHGRTRDYVDTACRNLEKQVPNLYDVDFACMDYRRLGFCDCVIYCDPPYQGTKGYNKTPAFDHDEFWNTMRKWSSTNIVLISEQDAPQDFDCIWEQETKRTINAAGERKAAVERLFTYHSS